MSTALTAIAIRDDQTTFDDLQRKALMHIGVDSAGPADLAVFFHTCKRTGLDPFARQIYMIRRDGKQTMQTGIDGLRLVAQRTAERTGETFGYEDTLWCDENGIWKDVWLSEDAPRAAKVVVLRNGQRFPAVALYGEYVQTYRDKTTGTQQPTKTWREKGALMLAKCAEAAALRKAFPMDLSGIYTPDEMRQDTAAAAAPLSAASFAPVAQPEVIDAEIADDPEPETGETISDSQRKAIFAAFTAAGFTTNARSAEGREARLAYMSQVLGEQIESTNNLTAAQAARVLDALNEDAQSNADPNQGDLLGGEQ